MVSTMKTGCYLIGGTQLIEDDAQAEAIIAAKVEMTTPENKNHCGMMP